MLDEPTAKLLALKNAIVAIGAAAVPCVKAVANLAINKE